MGSVTHMHLSKLLRKSSSGNALVMTLPLIIIVAAAVQACLIQSGTFANVIKSFRVNAARDSLSSDLLSYSTMGATFRASMSSSLPAGTNSDLQNCVFGGGASPCVSGAEMSLTLYSPVVTDGSSVPQLVPIMGAKGLNGAATQPVLYDLKGNLCPSTVTSATSDCPIEVFASFVPTCAAGALSCSVADSISVHYVLRLSPNIKSSVTLAERDVNAPCILVKDILPGPPDSVIVNRQVFTQIGIVGSDQSTTTDPLSTIIAAVEAAGVTKPVAVNNLANAFLNAGYTDPAFITAVTQAGYSQWGARTLADIIWALSAAKITNLDSAVFLTNVGVSDPDWMTLVLQSGVTNIYLANESYGCCTDPAAFAASVAAVTSAGLPNNQIAVAVIEKGVTDPAIATQMYNAVASIPDPYIAAGMIAGGAYTNPTLMNSILSAVSPYPSVIAESLAAKNITDPTLAAQIVSLVSIVSDPYDAADIIWDGGGTLAGTQTALNTYLLDNASTTTVSSTSGTSSTTTVVTNTTSTATTTYTQTTGTIGTCTTCTDITF